MVVLGISIGTRQSGVAIIDNTELVIWQILTINTDTQTHEQVLSRYVAQFSVSVVIIKLPPETHITKRMKELLHSLVSLFQQFGCAIHQKTDKSIKQTLPLIKNKQDIIDLTTNYYPDLTPEKVKESSNKNKYYIKLFEAVLIAHQHLLSDSPHY
jgi:RNase H-fold protein (predicted Holliday junction resolvase)